MTGSDVCKQAAAVPVIFELPCIYHANKQKNAQIKHKHSTAKGHHTTK